MRIVFSGLMICALEVFAGPRGAEAPKEKEPAWLGEQMPLPLTVKTPEDLAFKTAAEREYLQFNLLASGKVAWDRGDWAVAAERWESLLRMPGLPVELEALVRPVARAARERAAGAPTATALPVSLEPAMGSVDPAKVEAARALVTVSGLVTGGGERGPGGAVVMLRRADGPTPKPKPTRERAVVQKDKRFLPHVLAIPLGSTVEFRNEDEISHNVFSLSKPNEFDLGVYKEGGAKEQVFDQPGPVHLLCNIHASMQGWIYVSDTPYFTQADASGHFSLKNVPPGNWTVEVWHEWSTRPATAKVRVAAQMEELKVQVEGDRQPPAFVPDKSGKPRQPQLGY
jgi:plastocyanin